MTRWVKPAVVVRVIDGDTLVIDMDLGFNIWQKSQIVRLVGMDAAGKPTPFNAPELSEPLGKRAKAYLTSLIPPGTELVVETFKGRSKDVYGRWLAVCWIQSEMPEWPPVADLYDLAHQMAVAGHGYIGIPF